jgi:hypothetical protein
MTIIKVIFGALIALSFGCASPPLTMDKIAVHSRVGDDFYFFLAGTQDGISFNDRTHVKTIDRKLIAIPLEETICNVIKELGYDASPVSYDELKSKNLKVQGFTAYILIDKPYEGGDEKPSGIGIFAEPKKTFGQDFGIDHTDLSKVSFYINLQSSISEIDTYSFWSLPYRQSKTGIIKYPVKLNFSWPDSKEVEKMDLGKNASAIQRFFRPNIEEMTKNLIHMGQQKFDAYSDM